MRSFGSGPGPRGWKSSGSRAALIMATLSRKRTYGKREKHMLGTILIVVLVLMVFGALPTWPHSKQWGYFPSGGLGLLALILIIMLVLGYL
jgi:hypothetical protein